MKLRHLSLFFAAGLVSMSALAQSEVYVCTDKEGRREYKNTDIGNSCKRVDLPGLSMVPATVKRNAPAASAQTKAAPAKAAPVTPANFPKVDSATQRARDSDRRRILEDEMRAESSKLAELQKDYNNGQPERLGSERNYAKYQERVANMQADIARSEKNVEALQRELSKLK